MSDKDFMGHRLMERRLEDELPDEAELFEALGGRELHLDEVLTRAGGIQRRRRTLTGLVAAAAVVALVVPAGVILADRESASGPTPLTHPTTSTSTSPEPTADPSVAHTISLASLAGQPAGRPPAQGYVENGVWHDPDGSTFGVRAFAPYGVIDIAPVGGDLLVGTPAEETGEPRALLIDRGYRNIVRHSWPISGGFARSTAGQVAFVEPDGTPVVVDADSHGWGLLDRIPRGSGFEAAALFGGECKVDPQSAGCTVVVNSRGVHPEAWLVSSHGTAEPANSPVMSVDAAAADGRLAAMTSVDETLPGSCSEVQDARQQKLWDTCDNRFLAFSPDGSMLLAGGAYTDGLGDTQLDVVDATSGNPVVRYRVADGGAITAMRWEDDSHVLAVVLDQGVWGVVRAGLDGQVEVAVPPVQAKGDPTTSPFVMPH